MAAFISDEAAEKDVAKEAVEMRKCYYYAQTKDKELRIIELDRALFDPAWKPAQGKANPLIYQIFYLDLGPDNGFFNQYLGQDVDQS